MKIDKAPSNNFSELEKTQLKLKETQEELEKTKLELKVAQTTIKKLEEERHIDSLTGLPNNPETVLNKLIEELNYVELKHKESDSLDDDRKIALSAIGVAYMDMDHFKVINDTYGHFVGNEAIVAFVEHLKEITRSDLIFRSHKNGDEFVVIFPIRNTRNGRDISYEALEKLFERFETKANTGCSVRVEKDGSKLELSASMDFDILKKGESKTAKELLDKADERMRARKKESRKSR